MVDDEPDVWTFGDPDDDTDGGDASASAASGDDADASADVWSAGAGAGDDIDDLWSSGGTSGSGSDDAWGADDSGADVDSIWGEVAQSTPPIAAEEAAAAVTAALESREGSPPQPGTVPVEPAAVGHAPDGDDEDDEVFTFSLGSPETLDVDETPEAQVSHEARGSTEVDLGDVWGDSDTSATLEDELAPEVLDELVEPVQDQPVLDEDISPDLLDADEDVDVGPDEDAGGSMADRAIPIAAAVAAEQDDEDVWVFSVETEADPSLPMAETATPGRDTGWHDADIDPAEQWPEMPLPVRAATPEDDPEPQVVTLSTGMELEDALSAAAAAAAAVHELQESPFGELGSDDATDDDAFDEQPVPAPDEAPPHRVTQQHTEVTQVDELGVDDWFDDDLDLSTPAPAASPAPSTGAIDAPPPSGPPIAAPPPPSPAAADPAAADPEAAEVDQETGEDAPPPPPPPSLATMDLQNFSSGGRKRRRKR